jgi:hypothetical protein
MGVKEKPDIIDIIERKRLQWYGHINPLNAELIPSAICWHYRSSPFSPR